MSSTRIPARTKILLAGRAAGRCEYSGCNEELTEDQLTRRTDHFGAFAHIVADKPGGPRGDVVRSPQLANDIDNLMLLCQKHHKLIDGANWRNYSESLLREMKAEHEKRVRELASYQGEQRTHLLLVEGGIGARAGWVSREAAARAALPLYAQDKTSVAFSQSRIQDGEDLFWRTGVTEIERGVADVHRLFKERKIGHVSVFALAPIPLLIWLGYRLGDTYPGEAFQKRRTPDSWCWEAGGDDLGFHLAPDDFDPGTGPAILALDISGPMSVPGHLRRLPVLRLGVSAPALDIVRTRQQVESFKHHVRLAMTRLGGCREILVIAALPNSLAVEFGRVQLPKVHPPMVIYDRYEGRGGLSPVITLHGGEASLAG